MLLEIGPESQDEKLKHPSPDWIDTVWMAGIVI
jgi:hypothetical protein